MTKLDWEKNNLRKKVLQHGASSAFIPDTPRFWTAEVAGNLSKHARRYRPKRYTGKTPGDQVRHERMGTSRKRYVIREVERDTQISCTKTDKAHLAYGTANEEVFLDAIDSTIRSLVRSGIRNPQHQAAALNRTGKRTALNEKWDARLVILFYQRMNRLRVSRGLSKIRPKQREKKFTIIEEIYDDLPGEWSPKRKIVKKKKPSGKRMRPNRAKRLRVSETNKYVIVERVRKPRVVIATNQGSQSRSKSVGVRAAVGRVR